MRLSTVIFLVPPITIYADNSSQCASACQLVLSHIKFDGSSAPAPTDYYTSICTNLLIVPSTYLCTRCYCTELEIADGLASLDNTCRMGGIVNLFPWTIISNISNEPPCFHQPSHSRPILCCHQQNPTLLSCYQLFLPLSRRSKRYII